jgi:hypothetical protein
MEKSLQMLKKILASQADFKNQKPLLQEIIETKGHRVFDSIPLKQIRKYALRSAKYMECYRKGLTVLQAEYALKKYKSHRKINIMIEIMNKNIGHVICFFDCINS